VASNRNKDQIKNQPKGPDGLTVDEETGRVYDPEAPGGQERVAEAVGRAPVSHDLEAEDRVAAKDKLPGVPPVGETSGEALG
jgi:hypothetical protein